MPADDDADALSPAARRLYAYAVERHAFGAAEATDALGVRAAAALTELAAAQLVQPVPAEPGGDGGPRWSAVSPRAAVARALAPLALRMRATHDEMDLVRRRLDALVPEYEAGAARRDLEGLAALELVTDLGAVRAVIAELVASCEREVLTSQPGGGRPPATLEEAIGRDESVLARGVRMRTLYQHTARYSRPTAAYVERVTARGAQVRTLGDGLMRMIVVDGRTALMAVPDVSGAALVVREPAVVHFMTEAFERSWVEAEPFASTVSPDQARSLSDELRQKIVRLLSEGLEDKVIARRLGMSERTCQRHIAEIMRAVGAKSRFHAGYLLAGVAGRGLVTVPGSDGPGGTAGSV
ncbi:helix-turn-helix domain-containing protein [Streptomyces sp. G-G2]|uniref:LuxR C-terminal-related transcriptional regulator n=1 Tax=Streptomyces sp. G-G2 TaxID=3046201 RepID=UPI0024BBCC28|nr:helix-turn-helix domain-containing protein [Streptomyces sp. G-G2]MDJ0382927.1 helix-turn-helix domain-containing protein [Streptomyces sp. G-G2]